MLSAKALMQRPVVPFIGRIIDNQPMNDEGEDKISNGEPILVWPPVAMVSSHFSFRTFQSAFIPDYSNDSATSFPHRAIGSGAGAAGCDE